MSQFYVGVTAGALPPVVPTSFQTDSGSAVPAANVLNVLGNDTRSNNENGITTTGSGNTVTVLLSNRATGSANTVGVATTPIITFTPTTVGTYAFEFRVAAYNETASLGAGYSMFGSVRFDGANSNLCGTVDRVANEEGAMSSANVTMTVSGADILLNGVGYAAQDINWTAVGLYTFIGVV